MATKSGESELANLLRTPGTSFEDERIPMPVGLAMAAGEATGALLEVVEAPLRAIAAGRHLVKLSSPPDGGLQATVSELKSVPTIFNQRMDQVGRACGRIASKLFVRT